MHLLIAAAGSGTRMGAGCNKLLLPIAGRPILSWTLDAVLAADSIEWIGIVGQPIDKESIMGLVKNCPKPYKWINGGSTRQESIQLGLAGLPAEAKYVLIHDGARCLVETDLFNSCAQIVESGQAVIAATAVTDTIKKINSSGFIVETPDRSGLWAAQTPQGFLVKELRQAHSEAILNGWEVTDDASLYERLGWPVRIFDAGPSNIKVTTRFDLLIAETIIAMREEG
tara:strand:+ start:877 stop:1557 length:681 start_codon:yes stop_codon:yes gene_type:complete